MTSIPVDISVTEVSMPVEPAPKTANNFPFDLRASDLLEFRIKSGQTNTFVKIASTEIRIGLPEDVLVGGSSTYTDNEEWRFRRFGDKTARFIRLAQLRYVIKGDTPDRDNAPYGNESSVNPIFASEKTTFVEKNSIDFAGGSLAYPSTAHVSGTGDFTYEFWINFDTTSGDQAIFDARSSQTSDAPALYWNPSSSYYMYWYVSGGVRMKTTTSISAGAWYHIAIVRNSGTSTIYQDGVAEGTFSDTYNYAPYAGRFGARGQWSSAAYLFNGKMSNIRFSDNARYTANFTPPTANFTTDSNTLLLTGNSDNEGSISDLSSNSVSLSKAGTVDSAIDNPFATKHSMYFDGTGDYISAANHADFNVGSSDFTLECWTYIESAFNNGGICGLYDTGSNQRSYIIYQTHTSRHFGVAMSSDGTYQSGSGIDSNVDISNYLNQWVHLALTKSGTSATLYLNGNSIGTTSSAPSTLHASTSSFVVGKMAGADAHTTGYISDVRLVNGSVVYSSNFTPPIATLTAITNTKFLTGNINNAGVFTDLSTSSHTITVNGNTRFDTKSPVPVADPNPQSPMIALDDGSYWNSYSNGVGSNRFVKIPVSPRYDHLTVAIGKEYGSNVTAVCNAVRYEFIIKGQSGYFNRDGTETFEYVKDRGSSFRKRVDNDPSTVGTDAGGGGEGGGGGGAASGPVQSWGS